MLVVFPNINTLQEYIVIYIVINCHYVESGRKTHDLQSQGRGPEGEFMGKEKREKVEVPADNKFHLQTDICFALTAALLAFLGSDYFSGSEDEH